MKNTGDAIHVALTFDDAFWAPAYATMRSVCVATDRKADLVFHLLNLGLTPAHRKDLDAISEEFGATLVYHPLEGTDLLGERISRLPAVKTRRLHNIVYARLFIQHLLPADAERVIYLDCDVIVRTPIEHLAEMDMAGRTIAAVQQPERFKQAGGRDLREFKAISMARPYFNAGVMLIDLARYRQVDIVGVLLDRVPADQIGRLYYDQDIINIVFADDIFELDSRWNLQNPETSHEAFNPLIVHYSGSIKPWALKPNVAYARTYRHTMTNKLFYRYWRYRVVRATKRAFGLA
ncbi:general stress protein A [Devosia yakushimensis]|uniref:General stress protein A n=1 Tax=Devosia yakushimensis TaxID=470028 RepID=A0ABQ5UDI6_9HYPH|nr:glycosyltransferase family 8 protein [Devosia yakushimensis]GLQ09265.1 general stress protein A [Devosia yakushimensis]